MPDNKDPAVSAIRVLRASYQVAIQGYSEMVRAPLRIGEGQDWPPEKHLRSREQYRDEIRQQQAELRRLVPQAPEACFVYEKAPVTRPGPDMSIEIDPLWDRDELQQGYQALGSLLGVTVHGEPLDGAKPLRRKRRQRKVKPLTSKQTEAVQVFGECEYNYTHAAEKLGLSLAATKDRIQGAYKKLGEKIPAHPQKTARRLPVGHRGEVAIAAGGTPEPDGKGTFRGGCDRRLD